MKSYTVFVQREPVPNGRKLTLVYHDSGKRHVLEVKDHDAQFEPIGLIKAATPNQALYRAKEVYPAVARLLVVQEAS